jgi:hypothetical protein
VGDPVWIRLEVSYPDGFEVSQPAPGPEWGDLVVSRVEGGQPLRRPEGGWVRTDRLRVAAFKTGDLQAPPLAIEYKAPDGTVGRVETPPLTLPVLSVLSPREAQEISDLKDPASLPRRLWPWIAAAAGAAAAAAWFFWRRRRRRAGRLSAPLSPPLPPDEWAIQELSRLAAANLLAAGRWLDYHVILSEVVKEYLTRRYGVPTLERTTFEVLAGARAARLTGSLVADLRSLLEPCDLVKFARHRSERAEAEALLGRARTFVEATRPMVPPAAVAPSAPGAQATAGRG